MARDTTQTVPSALSPSQIAQVEGFTGKLDATLLLLADIETLLTSAPESGKTIQSVVLDKSSTGTVIAAVTGKRIKVFAILLTVDAAISVNFRSGASIALEGVQAYEAKGGYTQAVDPPNFLFGTTAGQSLDIVISGAGNVRGRISYWTDDAT